MIEYTRRESKVLAVQWFDDIDSDAFAKKHGMAAKRVENGLMVKTALGYGLAKDGYYIIKGSDGEFYPCRPETFHKLYECKS